MKVIQQRARVDVRVNGEERERDVKVKVVGSERNTNKSDAMHFRGAVFTSCCLHLAKFTLQETRTKFNTFLILLWFLFGIGLLFGILWENKRLN